MRNVFAVSPNATLALTLLTQPPPTVLAAAPHELRSLKRQSLFELERHSSEMVETIAPLMIDHSIPIDHEEDDGTLTFQADSSAS